MQCKGSTSFAGFSSELTRQDHVSSSFFLDSVTSSPVVGQPAMATTATPSAAVAPTKVTAPSRPGGPPSADNPSGYNQYPDPEAKGINPETEISRIESNILIYNVVLAAAAIGIGVGMCMFVRSILKPAKGYHGGDSDGEMDSDDEDDDESDES